MSPPSAILENTPTATTHEPGLSAAKANKLTIPKPPTFDDPYAERKHLKERLAAAFRIFGKYGFDEGVAGHITVRVCHSPIMPQLSRSDFSLQDPVSPHHFWVNPFGVSFSLIKASDLILVNGEGQVVDGGPVRLLNTAAFMIHSAIHQARPDVNAAAHSHSIYGRSFCTLGRPLDIITQDACAFYQVWKPVEPKAAASLTKNRTTSSTSPSMALSLQSKKARTLPLVLETKRQLCFRTTAFSPLAKR